MSGDKHRTIYIWNPSTGRIELTLAGHKRPVKSLLVLDDHHVVSGSKDGSVLLWDLRTVVRRNWRTIVESSDTSDFEEPEKKGSVTMVPSVRKIITHGGSVLCLGLLADGSVVSGGHTLKVWNMATGVCKAVLHSPYYDGVFVHVAGLSDGRVVSLGSGCQQYLSLWT